MTTASRRHCQATLTHLLLRDRQARALARLQREQARRDVEHARELRASAAAMLARVEEGSRRVRTG